MIEFINEPALHTLTIDKEFRELIPPLTKEERKQLATNIEQDGCRDTLVTWNGTIIDGHNRYAICHEKNIPFMVKEKAFEDRDGAIEWIIRNQLGRRNLTPFQRVELAERCRPIMEKQARERMIAGKSTSDPGTKSAHGAAIGRTDENLAKIAGVGKGTVQRGRTVIESGTNEEKQALRAGKTTINKVYMDIKAREQESQPEPAKPRPAKKLSAFDQRSQEIADSFRKFESRTRSDVDLEHLTGDIEVYTSGIADYLQRIDFTQTTAESRACAREVMEKHMNVAERLQNLLQEATVHEAT